MNRKVWAIVLCLALICAGGVMVSRYTQQRITISWAVFGLRQSAGAALGRAATYVELGMDEAAPTADRAWGIIVTRELLQGAVDAVRTLETIDRNLSSWMQIRCSLELAMLELTDWQQNSEGFPRAQEISELLTAVLRTLPSVLSSDDGGTVYADNPAGLAEAAAFAEGYLQRIKAARSAEQGG